MGMIDKDLNPLDTPEGLEDHIQKALAATPLSGKEIDLTYRLVKLLFNPKLIGADRIPDKPCLFIGNHSLFALDGMVLIPTLLKERNLFIHGLADKFMWANDSASDFLIKRGTVMGNPDVCSALMQAGRNLLVFPGGALESVKPSRDLYSLQWKERYGFVRLAAEHGYTIQPFGMVGPDEFYSHLMEGEDLPDSLLGKALKRLNLLTENTRSDLIPPIPRGTLGTLIPKPKRCFVGFGEPIDLSEHKGKTLSKQALKKIRSEVAEQVEDQLGQMLLLREQRKGNESLLRRVLSI